MCGIFGYIGSEPLSSRDLSFLVTHSQIRGRDSSGLFFHDTAGYNILKGDFGITRLIKRARLSSCDAFFGHSRLITNGLSDNQPVVRDGIAVIHNGIVVNHNALWSELDAKRELEIDTEIIPALAREAMGSGSTPEEAAREVLARCRGVIACAMAIPASGELILFSNNGSLYLGNTPTGQVFASEQYPLTELGCQDVIQVRDPITLKIPSDERSLNIKEWKERRPDLVAPLILSSAEEKLLDSPEPSFRRCTKCVLPETMPYIRFDDEGVCNYCTNYKVRNHPRPKEEMFNLIAPYRKAHGTECIVPFSGGRDSCYALHLIVRELDLRPVTYTYDWGMVTDLGRRNISRMCSELGVENIIVAADITKKRRNIEKNLRAWLASPHLGMVSILTAGDKHFFRHIETMKRQTGVDLNLWGINPLEVTHFKAGFLGVPPDFEEERVYSHGAMKQLRYQRLRLGAMVKSPRYFNTSLWDTLSGEYFRSFYKKSDYYHVFDYWRWDEDLINTTLDTYDWERAPDTTTTWRIGDGTAAFYNYIYHVVAGFTEHDTFRSNQVREGDITREEALRLVKIENQPRYPNIKWYLDAVNVDFSEAISVVNRIPRLYETS